MKQTTAKLQARLKWEAACERLAFALRPPSGAPPDAPDVNSAVKLAQAALEEVRQAFGVADASSDS
ncbi:hypothetical protein WKW80_24140 [Variovorax humicola]|uniref:HEPN domain-containing protein n=1 Tax=Variovorax humicola TaxID=1769758 RepID=A0ABU8W723_9BURK